MSVGPHGVLLPVLQQAAINAEVEAAAASVEAELDAQEWNMQEIERIQEEQASLTRLPHAGSKKTLG